MMSHGGGVVKIPLMKVTCPEQKVVESVEIPPITCLLLLISRREGIGKELVIR